MLLSNLAFNLIEAFKASKILKFYLREISVMFSNKIRKDLLQQISAAKRQLHHYTASHLYYLEARYTLFDLQKIFIFCPGDSMEETLINFFSERWERIQKTNTHYLHDFTNPANQVCIAITKVLAKKGGTPYLAILMPSLLQVMSKDYLSSSYTDEVDLKEIVLSDCNQRIIHVADVLDYAQEDGVLKHNSLFTGRMKVLSQSEKSRVLSRHVTVKEAYEALLDRISFKLYGDTAGAALNRLIHGLREGGVHQGGQELDSGLSANVAIVEFNDYLETLDENTKQQLMVASKDDYFTEQAKKDSVDSQWEKLARPNGTDNTLTVYCVELIADRLYEILAENPGLYQLVSNQSDAMLTLAQFDEKVEQTRQAVKQALPILEVHACYDETENNALCAKLLPKLQQDKNFELEAEDITFIAEQFSFAKRVNNQTVLKVSKEILTQVGATYNPKFIKQALNKMSKAAQQQFVQLTGLEEPPQSNAKLPYVKTFFSERKRKNEERNFSELTRHV